jgi:hypothetical protein
MHPLADALLCKGVGMFCSPTVQLSSKRAYIALQFIIPRALGFDQIFAADSVAQEASADMPPF